MIGHGKVVVNGLGNAHKFDIAAGQQAVIIQLFDGIHGIISADIEEILHFQLFQDRKDLIINRFGALFMDTGQLITAGAQISGGCTLEQFNIQVISDMIGQIDITLIKQSLDTVKHAINLTGPAVLSGFKNADQTGINNSGRTT